MLLESEFFMK